jgi:hypothetical protein
MTRPVVTCGVGQMLENRMLQLALTALLCAFFVPACAVMAEDDGIVITKEREVRKPLRIVDNNEICPEENIRYRLAVSKIAPNDPYFRFDNLSSAPIFVSLMQDGETYRTDYPSVEVLFKSAKDSSWSAPVMNPGSFIGAGLRRISLSPGAHIVFRAPVAVYVPRNAEVVKLQLRFDTLPHGTAYNDCVSSTPFTLRTGRAD